MKQLLVLVLLSLVYLANSKVLLVILVDSSSNYSYAVTAATTAQEINNCPSLLNGYTLQVKTVSSQFPSSVVEVAKVLRDAKVNGGIVIGMIGQVDKSFAHSLLPVPQNTGIIQIIEPAGMMLDRDKDYPNLFTLLPSLEAHISTALQLLPALNWTSVGVIYSGGNARAAETFVTLSNHSDILITTKSFEYYNNSHELQQWIEQSSLKIFVVMLPKHQLCQLLSTVQRKGWTWPDYAWVVLNEHPLQNTTSFDFCGSKTDILEDIIFINQLSKESTNRTTVDIPCNRTQYNTISTSLWALALAWNMSTINGNTSHTIIKDYLTTNIFDSILVTPYTSETQTSIIQIQSGVSHKVGSFYAKTRELEINLTNGELPTAYPAPVYLYELFPRHTTALTLTMVVLCVLLTTIVLVLFVYYRKEPEIKASSFSISLCMFVAIYLALAASFSHFIESGINFKSASKYFGCNFTTYCTALATDIVLATLLMKMLRLWRVFTFYGNTGKVWTDKVMLLFSGAILLIKVLILTIWAILDTLHTVDKFFTNSDGNTVLVRQCQSNNTILWAFLAYGYSGVLGTCLIIVAIKTRKIKRNNFKDTKKICLVICALAYIVIQTITLWWVLRLSHEFSTSNVIFGIGMCVGSMTVLGVLFGPKIFSPIQRKFRLTRSAKGRTSTRRRIGDGGGFNKALTRPLLVEEPRLA
ncbi:gamma-aminobutyric acid type B receptor subunit 1-like [Halichondria panicea]|uniref:gamma-aminobutyric acid type B receptor subunit 1-like n=1 Tax=Halichondria panicea TaxID=6063 RepID=UPI00312B3AD1